MDQVVEHLSSKCRGLVQPCITKKTNKRSWIQWLMPVILASWKSEIKRIMVWGQSGKKKKKVFGTSSQWAVVCAYHPSDGRKCKIDLCSRPVWAKSLCYFAYFQNYQSKKSWKCDQQAFKILSSNESERERERESMAIAGRGLGQGHTLQ
jgi:hypothetical protein